MAESVVEDAALDWLGGLGYVAKLAKDPAGREEKWGLKWFP
jgi:hypothetical protein